MKKQYIKPEVEVIHAAPVILAGTTDIDPTQPNLPLDPNTEEEGYGD